MNVSLPPQLDQYVRGLVRGGTYGSASEVVREGLRLLQQREATEAGRVEVRALIREGAESPATPYDRDAVRSMLLGHAAERRGEADG